MATIYNSNLSKELIDGAKIQTSFDKVPDQIAEKVVPVMEVNPKLLKLSLPFPVSGALSNALSATLYTTSSIKDTYLTGATMSMIKDATSTATDMRFYFTEATTGQTRLIFRITGLSLTADSKFCAIDFNKPMKVARGTNIMVTSNTADANISIKGTLFGYEEENINA